MCNTELGGGKGGLESNNTDTHSVLPRDGARQLIRNYSLVMSLPVKMDLRLLFLSMDPANKISIVSAAAQDEHFAITVPIHGPPSQIVCGGAFSKTRCGSSVFCFVLDSTRLVLLLDANSILPDIDLIQARPDPKSSPIRSDLDRMRLRRDPTATWTRLRRDWARARPDPIKTRPALWILDRSEVELGRAWPGSEGIFLEPGRSSAGMPVQRYVQRYVQRQNSPGIPTSNVKTIGSF